jgi:hypothetical protein
VSDERTSRLHSSTLIGWALLLQVGIAAWPCPATAGALSPQLEFHGDPETAEFGSVDLAGLSSEALQRAVQKNVSIALWQDLFACFTAEAAEHPDWPAVLGDYRVIDGVVRFRPLFPFAAGSDYTCRFDPGSRGVEGGEAAGMGPPALTFTMPNPVRPEATRVTMVHPSLTTVPENLLRVYITFSAPMQRKGVHDHVRLLDRDGEEIALPFVQVEQGLWDAESRRLTLFLHPGRIKRGVGPHDSMGPVLQAGETYRLVIDGDLRDAQGYPLSSAHEEQFMVVAADRVSPDPSTWVIGAPHSLSAPVTLHFPEALDHALLGRFIVVLNAGGALVPGRVAVTPEGTGWSFVPGDAWVPGAYRLVVNPALEDLAGNTLTHLFDEEAGAVTTAQQSTEVREIKFSVPAP